MSTESDTKKQEEQKKEETQTKADKGKEKVEDSDSSDKKTADKGTEETDPNDPIAKLLAKQAKLEEQLGPSHDASHVTTISSGASSITKAFEGQKSESERKQAAMFPGNIRPNHQQMKHITDQKGQNGTLNPEFAGNHATIYFKNDENCDFKVESQCVKLLIESCKDSKFDLAGKVLTSVVEVWKCDRVKVTMHELVATLQVDLCHDLELIYTNKENFGSIVWAGIFDLKIRILDESGKPIPEYNIDTGVEQMKKQHPDLNEEIDQFIIRFVDGKLLQEMIVRLENGYPTTQREADEFDELAKKNAEAAEAYVRELVTFGEKKLGLDRLEKKEGEEEESSSSSSQKKDEKKKEEKPELHPLHDDQDQQTAKVETDNLFKLSEEQELLRKERKEEEEKKKKGLQETLSYFN